MVALIAFGALTLCALAALALADMRREAAERLAAIALFLFVLTLALCAMAVAAGAPRLLDAALMTSLIAAPLVIGAAKAMTRARGDGA